MTPLSPAGAQAVVDTVSASEDPIEITAAEAIEWHRNNSQYIAKKDVVVKQGSVTIKGQTLTADYSKNSSSFADILRITVQKAVSIKDKSNTAFGDQAVYDVKKGLATMTGNNLRLVSPEQVIQADTRFEYWTEKAQAKAIGNALVIRGDDKLKADQITAYFVEDAAGKQKIDRIEAIGNVEIKTPTEVLTGNKGTYRSQTNIAKIIGDVRIARGPNILEGTHGEVNLNTNVSKIFGGKQGTERVRGVFYPDSQDSKNQDAKNKEIGAQ